MISSKRGKTKEEEEEEEEEKKKKKKRKKEKIKRKGVRMKRHKGEKRTRKYACHHFVFFGSERLHFYFSSEISEAKRNYAIASSRAATDIKQTLVNVIYIHDSKRIVLHYESGVAVTQSRHLTYV